MSFSGLRRFGLLLAGARGRAVLLVAAAVAAMPVGVAAASGAARASLRPVGLGARSELSLAQAPAGLRAAIRRTLGVRSTGADSVFQRAKLTASDHAAGNQFGSSVAFSGSTAVVGAPFKNSRAGAAYVFVRSGSRWSQQAKLTASDAAASDFFGVSVALSGSTAVVGADGKNFNTGAAYVFVRSGSRWSQQAKLTASGGAAGDDFGDAVAISGSTAVAGADGKNSNTGAAYAFVRSGSRWSQQAELSGSDAVAGDAFGGSVAISGSTAVVGAFGHNSNAGAAYVFVRSALAWSQQAKLTASDAAAGDEFGGAVAVSGSTAVVGAELRNAQTGAAYVFVRSGAAWSQQAELTASDAAAGDVFGASVAISGSTAVVGAWNKNSRTGAAYVFVRSASAWSQQAKLTASDAASGDLFGWSVAVSGSTAVVGAPGKNSRTGAAYVFALPHQQAELTGADAASGDFFGTSVAFSGSTAVVGAPFKNSRAGAAYVFVRSGSRWSQQAELTASHRAARGHFGVSVAISGSTVVIGADTKDSRAGAAYVFVRMGTRWSKQAKLTASDAARGDFFGVSVAISGSTAVVGAHGKNSFAGAAYVFARTGTAWSQQAKLTASDATAGDEFGASVAISGSTVVVGAPFKKAGAAYVFVRSASAWSQQAKLTASGATTGDQFGFSVAISGSTVVVGAPVNSSDTGAAYVFARSGAAWSQQAELTASDGAADDFFGSSVAISGSTAVVGAPSKNSNAGAAYVYARSGTAWSQQAELTASNAAANDFFGVSVAISGQTAVVGASGKNSSTGAAYAFGHV